VKLPLQRRPLLPPLLLGSALLLAACGPGRADAPASAAGGRRIVSLAPNLTEILFALDLGDQVVGVTDFCNYPEEAAAKPRIGGFVNPNLEAILELDPDLAVATPNIGNRDAVLRLESLGVEFLILETPDLEGLYGAIRSIAAHAGVAERGAALVARMTGEVDRIRSRVSGEPPTPALMVFAHDPLVVAGEGTFFGDMMTIAGGRNVADAARGRFPHFSLEEVVRAGPEVIIETVMGAGGEPDVAFWERFETIPAVRDGRICTPTPDLVLRPGPRATAGLAELAACLHPPGPS
jgi:iron complex transport system substrate-binding protein